MSAFFVSKEHIDILVSAALEYKAAVHWQLRRDYDADDIGKILWRENLKSLAARYPNDFERMGSDDEIERYRYHQYCILKPIAVLKIVHCYQYQSCEHDDWEKSQAFKLCKAIESAIIRRLPGYEAAPWGISDKKQLAEVCSPGAVSLFALAKRAR